MNANVRGIYVALLLMAVLGVVLAVVLGGQAFAPHVVLVLGLVLLGLGVWRRRRAMAMSQWVRTTATLVTCEEGSFEQLFYEAVGITNRFPVVTYTYLYAGRTHLGSRVAGSVKDIALSDADDPEHGQPGSKAFWKDWSVGTTLPAYVNPKQPEQAVLTLHRAPAQASQDLALIVAGLLIVSLWGLLVFG